MQTSNYLNNRLDGLKIPSEYWDKLPLKSFHYNHIESDLWALFGSKKLNKILSNKLENDNILIDYDIEYKKDGSKWSKKYQRIRINPNNREIFDTSTGNNKELPKYLSSKNSGVFVFQSHFETFDTKKNIHFGTEGELKAIAATYHLNYECDGYIGHATSTKAIKDDDGKTIDARFYQQTIDSLLSKDCEKYVFILDSDALNNYNNSLRQRSFNATCKKLLFAVNNYNKDNDKSLKLDIIICNPINSKYNDKYGIDDLIVENINDLETIKYELHKSENELNKYFRIFRNIDDELIEKLNNLFHHSQSFNDKYQPCEIAANQTIKINRYISEKPYNVYDKTLVVSPTNSGKSYDIWNRLVSEIFSNTCDVKIIVASPLTALAQQQFNDAIHHRNGKNKIALVAGAGAGAEQTDLDNDIFITTYASIDKFAFRMIEQNISFILILDEVTELVRATYQNNYSLGKIMDKAFAVIGLTGTPLKIFNDWEKIEYDRKDTPKRKVKLFVCKDIDTASSHLIENSKQGQVLNAFPSRRRCEIHTNELLKKGIESSFFHSKQSKTDKENNNILQSIFENSELPTNTHLTITNKIMEFGVNIKNCTTVNYVSASTFDYINFVQLVNRARNYNEVDINIYLQENTDVKNNSDLDFEFIDSIKNELEKQVNKLNDLLTHANLLFDNVDAENLKNSIKLLLPNNVKGHDFIRFDDGKYFVWYEKIINWFLDRFVNTSYNTYDVINILKSMFDDLEIEIIREKNIDDYKELTTEFTANKKTEIENIKHEFSTNIDSLMNTVRTETGDKNIKQDIIYHYEKSNNFLSNKYRFEYLELYTKRFFRIKRLTYGTLPQDEIIDIIFLSTQKFNIFKNSQSSLINMFVYDYCIENNYNIKKLSLVSKHIFKNMMYVKKDKLILSSIKDKLNDVTTNNDLKELGQTVSNLLSSKSKNAFKNLLLNYYNIKSVVTKVNGKSSRVLELSIKELEQPIKEYLTNKIDKVFKNL